MNNKELSSILSKRVRPYNYGLWLKCLDYFDKNNLDFVPPCPECGQFTRHYPASYENGSKEKFWCTSCDWRSDG